MELKLPEEIDQSKFKGLDGLRGIAVILVIIFHISKSYSSLPLLGTVGVNIFFVLSGFLITTLLLKEKIKYGYISLKNFYIRRGLRIIPVIYLFLIVLFVLNRVYDLNVSRNSFIASALFLRNLPVLPGMNDWYTTHFWTLGIEEQFYLVWPVVISRMSLRYIKPLILISYIVFTSLAYIYFARLDLDIFHVSRPAHITLGIIVNLFGKGSVSILIGSLFAILYLEDNKLIKALYKHPRSYSLALLALAIIIYSPLIVHTVSISNAIFAFIMAMLILLNLKADSLWGSFLETRVLKQIGLLSYSLYVWQQIFTSLVPWTKINTVYTTIFNLLLLVAVSCLSYYLYESRFLKWKERYKKV